MAAENPTWGAPRIHGELLKLGFNLRNHRDAIAAMDFFTVRTLTFGVLYCFFIMGHDRRKILGFNVTRNPNALWIVQQIREAWPYTRFPRFLLFDHDSKFGTDVISASKVLGSQPTRTAFRSPWQNGVAERWVDSCRRDLLDHVIILNERHLKRLMAEYVRYYHEDRTHLRLTKDTPAGRPIAIRSAVAGKIESFPRPRRTTPSLRRSSVDQNFFPFRLISQPVSAIRFLGWISIDHPRINSEGQINRLLVVRGRF